MQSTIAETRAKGAFWLGAAAWLGQILVAAIFAMAGSMKLTQPISELAKMLPWAGQLPVPVVRGLGLIDLAGAIGMVLPALLRIAPRLTTLAAAGCVALQACAIIFHLSRGEASVVPFNIVLIAVSAFVLWVRWKKVPIMPR